MVNYCCVPNCPSNGKNVTMHVFPRDEKLCKKWLDIIDNNVLLGKPFEVLRKNRRICDMHFSMEVRYQKRGTTGLKARAVPNLHLNLPKGFSKYSEVQLLAVRNPKQQDDGNDVQQDVSPNSGKALIEDSAQASTSKAGENEMDPITELIPQPKRDSILARVNDKNENTELEREVTLETGSVLENEGTTVNSQEVFEETATKTQEITTRTLRTVGTAKRKRLEREMNSPKIDEALGILRSAVENSALKTDGCSIYGQHVANKLRCYTKRVQNIVEHHINNIL